MGSLLLRYWRWIQACKEQGVPGPFWYEHDGFVTVTFPMPDPQGDTQADTQGINDLDKWLLNQIKYAPSITSEKLASLSGKSVITIKRHLKKMKNVRYVGSGNSAIGKWMKSDGEKRRSESNRIGRFDKAI